MCIWWSSSRKAEFYLKVAGEKGEVPGNDQLTTRVFCVSKTRKLIRL
jgi:hypothetical protein